MTIENLLSKNETDDKIYKLAGIVLTKTNAINEIEYTIGLKDKYIKYIEEAGFKTVKDFVINKYGHYWVKKFSIAQDTVNSYILNITY